VTTERPGTNEGIILSGHGQLNAGAVAVGRQATAISSGAAADARLQEKGLEDVRLRLDQLLRAIDSESPRLQQPGVVKSAADSITRELAKEKPDGSLLTLLLDGLAKNVQSVTSVLGAAEALRAAVTAFFHL